MRIKIRYVNDGGFTRLENFASLKEIMINEDFLHPENESIALGFRNRDSSGIIELTVEEFDRIAHYISKKKHLIKSIKVLRGGNSLKAE